MDMVRCPDCGGWDVTDIAPGEYRCLECGILFNPGSDVTDVSVDGRLMSA